MNSLAFFITGCIIFIIAGVYIRYLSKTIGDYWTTSPGISCSDSVQCCQKDYPFFISPMSHNTGPVQPGTFYIGTFWSSLTVNDENKLVTVDLSQDSIQFTYNNGNIFISKNGNTYYLPVITSNTKSIQLTSDATKAGKYTICAYQYAPGEILQYGIYSIDNNINIIPNTSKNIISIIILSSLVVIIVGILWVTAIIKFLNHS